MIDRKQKSFKTVRGALHFLKVIIGALGLTLAFFLVLPLIQTLSKPPRTDLNVQSVDTAQLDTPDPPPEPEEEEEPEPEEEPPPELSEETPPLDLSQLELALNPGFGEGMMQGDFAVNLKTVAGGNDGVDALFSLSDLDQKPRVIYQASPVMTKDLRKKAPGTVYVLFIVDKNGRVENPIIQSSTDPVFERPVLNVIKKWKFEPGKRNGQAVRCRMRIPITFPKG